MAKVYAIDGVVPVVDPGAFVHPAAILIGDVIIGSGVYVGPGASLRGDFGRIVIEAGANVQDNCIMHSFPDLETRIAENGHIGHGAILHGCTVGRNAMVGMNAVVMDGVVLGESSIVAAMAFVKSGVEIPPRSLVAGIPGKVIRAVTEEELAWKTKGTREYHELVRRCRESLVEVEPLAAPEPDRPRVRAGDIQPRYMMRKPQNDG